MRLTKPPWAFGVIAFWSCMIIGLWSVPAGAQATDTAPSPPSASMGHQHPDYRIPDRITLCGEEFPLNNRDVYERMDYEFLVAVNHETQVFLWLRRAGRYFPHIEKRLKEEGMPDDLKYLAVAESDLRPVARSRAAATGTWQFMEYTGRKYGLRKDKFVDERMNFVKSTDAAIRYLKRLHAMFGNWTLAMAAYNCGEGCVGRAIKEQKENSYFRLNLPTETERYVYRIAAIKAILENPRKYGYSMSRDLVYPPIPADKVRVDISKPVHITDVAKAIGTYYKALKELNPEIKGKELPSGVYEIYVPAGLGSKVAKYLKTASPPEPVKTVKGKRGSKIPEFHMVKRGDTLNSISQRYNVPLSTLRKLNNINGSHIWVGQKLRLQP